MSFSYLNVGETRLMGAAEYASHQIDVYGSSALPEYYDSIFTVNVRNYLGSYIATRILKKDLELPLNEPVELPLIKACALRLNDDGTSVRPDLRSYRFTIQDLGDCKYKITKKLRAAQ